MATERIKCKNTVIVGRNQHECMATLKFELSVPAIGGGNDWMRPFSARSQEAPRSRGAPRSAVPPTIYTDSKGSTNGISDGGVVCSRPLAAPDAEKCADRPAVSKSTRKRQCHSRRVDRAVVRPQVLLEEGNTTRHGEWLRQSRAKALPPSSQASFSHVPSSPFSLQVLSSPPSSQEPSSPASLLVPPYFSLELASHLSTGHVAHG